MVRVEWAVPAVVDLQEIHDFTARDSLRYAQATIEKITDAAARLARFPQMGEVLPEFRQQAYRQLVVGAYRLVYREELRSDRVIAIGAFMPPGTFRRLSRAAELILPPIQN